MIGLFKQRNHLLAHIFSGSVVLAGLLAANASHAQPQIKYAISDRIITLERWKGREATVWAIQKQRIVVYKISDHGESELLAQKPISSEQLAIIRMAIAAIPKEHYGYLYIAGHSSHPPLLRLYFSENGKWERNRIELAGYAPDWIRKLLEAVTNAGPERWPLDYAEIIAEYYEFLGRPPSQEIFKKSIYQVYEVGPKKWWEFWRRH